MPEPERRQTLQEILDGDSVLKPLQHDLKKITTLAPGTPPQGTIAQWMPDAISEHGK